MMNQGPNLRELGRRLANDKSLVLLAGVILPNALAVGAELFYVGLPPRTLAIVLYGCIAALSGRVRPAILVAAYIAVLAFDTISSIAAAFYIAQIDLVGYLHLGSNINIFASPLYTALAAGFLMLIAANVASIARLRTHAGRGALALLAIGTVITAGWDRIANASPHYDFGPSASAGVPFESAVQQSGFIKLASAQPTKGRHVLLVLVESLGVLVDPSLRDLVSAPLRDADLRERYDLTEGRTVFFGSTSYGEMRELCQTRESYKAVIEGDDPVCLPDLFDQQGYRTVSVHGFNHAFYDRTKWYPKIGFARSIFMENLQTPVRRWCGGPFVGPCDVDLATGIGERLATAKQPQFIYWLTLNTHVPVRVGQATPRFRCKEQGGAFHDIEVCSMAELWADLFQAVAKLAKEHPDLEVLMVGDHAPPLWRRSARAMFEPGLVPWFRLTPRRTEAEEDVMSGAVSSLLRPTR